MSYNYVHLVYMEANSHNELIPEMHIDIFIPTL